MTFIFDATTRRFARPPRLIALHWTAGIGDGVEELADVERVTRVLLGRRCSIHFIVDTDGVSVQTASLDRRCVHAGVLNDSAIGIEVISPGIVGDPRGSKVMRLAHAAYLKEKARGIVRDVYSPTLRGRRPEILDYTRAQAKAVTALVERLCDELGIARRVPVEADGSLVARQMTAAELAAFDRGGGGALGHYMVHDTKLDPGTAPLERLRVRWT